MIRLAELSIRRPKLALAGWATFAVVFIALGLGLVDRLSPTMTFVPGTESTHAEDLAKAEFGPSTLVPILLTGPQSQLDRQGPILVKELTSRKDVRTLSAWDAGEAGAALRPSRTEAMIVASVARSEQDMVDHVQSQLNAVVDAHVTAPVRAHITGQPTLDRAIQDEALHTARVATLLALPILFLALLLVLRAPVAALITTLFGGATAFVGFGVMTVVAEAFDIDAIGVALAAVMGLALGTGLSLMILTRFRSEEAAVTGASKEAAVAASATVASTGRAVLIAGAGLVTSLFLASAIGPTDNLLSVGTGVTVNALLAVGAAVVVMPAVLTLLGGRMFAGSFGAPRLVGQPWRHLAAGRPVLRRAVIAGGAGTLALVALAIPALGIETGPPDPSFLPKDSKARQDFEAVQRAMGPGWPTPYNIVVVSHHGPITERSMLRQLERFQAQIARDPRVESVAGPGLFRAKTADLGTLKKKLDESNKLLKGAPGDLGKLKNGLGTAGAGALQLQSGLQEAASGASQLQGGGASAQDGARQLEAGLAAARAGSAKVSAGLGQALSGANDLKGGSGQALAGAKLIAEGSGTAAEQVTAGLPVVTQMAKDVGAGNQAVGSASGVARQLNAQIGSAQAALGSMTSGKNDPAYQQVQNALAAAQQSSSSVSSTLGGVQQSMQSAAGVATAFAGQVGDLSQGLTKLHNGATDLSAGIARLQGGNTKLAAGIAQLNGGGSQLTDGLTKLHDGAGQLAAGLGLLTGGAGQLSGGLSGAVPKVGQLAGGLGLMESGVAKFRGSLPSTKDLERLQAEAPGLFDSGYFVLSAVDGAQPADRNQATFAVNLERGGNAGQITVIPRHASSSGTTQALGEDLASDAHAFAKASGTTAVLGGPAGELADFQSSVSADIWPVVIGLAIAVTLLLMVALRSVLLPILTVAFNLLTAAATFGVLTLLTTGSDPVLGGPGYIDPLQLIETFAAVFGIALVYELLLLYRTRELFVRSGEPHTALAEGLRETAGAATGAAAVMIAAIVPFSMSGLFNLRLTIGLAIAILLDALIVRPVILPAAVELLGRRAWWPTKPRERPPADVPAPPSGKDWRVAEHEIPVPAGGSPE
jgi:putative drug exporter of the RND superfamily